MDTQRLFVGVDGGGTKTLALLANEQGELLGRGQGGTANYQSAGEEAALAAIERAVDAAFTAAGIPPRPPDALCLGLAGVDRPDDRALFERWLAEHMPQATGVVVNDADLLLAAGTPEGWGVAVICGTGAIAVGRRADGVGDRADGWGYLLGDAGSGYAIGRATLRAVMRAADGRGPATSLTETVLAHWGLAIPDDLIDRVYRKPLAPKDVARLAVLAEQAAQAGDTVALALIEKAGRDLAESAATVVRKLALPTPTPCALAGGAILHGATIRSAFLLAAEAAGLRLEPVQLVTEPAQGAVRLALRAAKAAGLLV